MEDLSIDVEFTQKQINAFKKQIINHIINDLDFNKIILNIIKQKDSRDLEDDIIKYIADRNKKDPDNDIDGTLTDSFSWLFERRNNKAENSFLTWVYFDDSDDGCLDELNDPKVSNHDKFQIEISLAARKYFKYGSNQK